MMDYTGKENSGCTPAGDRRFYSKRTVEAEGAKRVQIASWFMMKKELLAGW